MTDSTPQLRFLSTNVCPNAGPDWLSVSGKNCSDPAGSMTSWGYCGMCWENNRVPGAWVERVSKAIDQQWAERMGLKA